VEVEQGKPAATASRGLTVDTLITGRVWTVLFVALLALGAVVAAMHAVDRPGVESARGLVAILAGLTGIITTLLEVVVVSALYWALGLALQVALPYRTYVRIIAVSALFALLIGLIPLGNARVTQLIAAAFSCAYIIIALRSVTRDTVPQWRVWLNGVIPLLLVLIAAFIPNAPSLPQ
jgi:hypothetical protein